MCAVRLIMEDWTHKHHRQGLFSSNSNDFSPWIFCTQSLQCLLDPSNSCLSQWSFDSIFGFVVSKKAIWFVAFFGSVGPMFPCNKSHEAMKNSSLSAALPEAWGPWELQHAPPTHYGCIMLAKDRVVVSKLWITDYWLWSRLFYTATAASQWRIVEIDLLATVGWKQGCQPAFQLPMLAKCDAQPKRDLCDMFVAGIHSHHHHSFWNSNYPLYQKLEVPESCSTLHQFWIISSSPSLCCTCRKNQSYAKNWTIAKIELLATVGWKQGCQPFSCRCWQNVMHCRKEIYATCLFKESVFLWKSKLALYQKLEVPERCSTLHQLIMVASCLQEIELWYPSFGLQVLIVISACFIQRLLQVNEELPRLSF